jgi:hypothetical protein
VLLKNEVNQIGILQGTRVYPKVKDMVLVENGMDSKMYWNGTRMGEHYGEGPSCIEQLKVRILTCMRKCI